MLKATLLGWLEGKLATVEHVYKTKWIFLHIQVLTAGFTNVYKSNFPAQDRINVI